MKKSSGLSLLELLIGITVASVAGGLLINLMVSSNKLFIDQTTLINQGLSLNQTKLEVSDLIKSSAGIAAQYPVTGSPLYTTDADTLILKLPAISAGGDVIESVYDYAIVEADAAKSSILRKQIFKDNQSFRNEENKVLSTALDTIDFSYFDSNSNLVSPNQAERVSFIIYLSNQSGFAENESSGSGSVNIKNL